MSHARMPALARAWMRRHLKKGHDVQAAKGRDRFILTCSCGATYLITK